MWTEHPEDGHLQAHLDGELEASDARAVEAHVEACTDCAEALSGLTAAWRRFEDAVVGLDVAAPDPEVPQWRLAATDERATREAPRPLARAMPRAMPRIPLARAAILVLALGGAASAAIPGSPVWRMFERDAPDASATTPVGASAAAMAELLPGGIRMDADEAVLRIEVRGVQPGIEARVRVVEAPEHAVSGGPDARYLAGPGRIDVDDAGGRLEIELSERARSATIVVNGAVVFELRDGRAVLSDGASAVPDVESAGAAVEYVITVAGSELAGGPER